MPNQLLTYGSRTYEVVCETDADVKKLQSRLNGTLAIGGLLGVTTTEGVVHLGFPTGVEIVMVPRR